MAQIATTERLQQTLSMAMEDRSGAYEDLVSNSNILWHQMKQNNMMRPYSGPRIRQSLVYDQTGTFVRYRGADYLNVTRNKILNDAEWLPYMMAVSVVLTMEDILNNQGENEIIELMATYMDVAETELVDRWVEDVHSAGTATNQIEGLQAAIPTDPTTGTYGSIDRATVALWRTKSHDINSDFSTIGTQFTSSTAQQILLNVVIQSTRNKQGPDLLLMSTEHYQAYSTAITAIQRVNDENELGKLGFSNLKFYGAGRSIDCVLEGGIGTAMPSNVTYGIHKKSLKYRYNPSRHFKPFGGKQTPINQDMVVQHIGSMGNLTQCTPLFNFKLHDTDTAS